MSKVKELKVKHIKDSEVRVRQYDHQNHGGYYLEMSDLAEKLESQVRELEESNQHLVEAIQFTLETDCPLEFLRCWNEGNFEAIKEEWPEFNGYLGEKGE